MLWIPSPIIGCQSFRVGHDRPLLHLRRRDVRGNRRLDRPWLGVFQGVTHALIPYGQYRHSRGRFVAQSGIGPDPLPIRPQQELKQRITSSDGRIAEVPVKSRIDTAIEVDYYKHGGILPFVLRELMGRAGPVKKAA